MAIDRSAWTQFDWMDHQAEVHGEYKRALRRDIDQALATNFAGIRKALAMSHQEHEHRRAKQRQQEEPVKEPWWVESEDPRD